ncbi:MAG TPA: glutaredoxin domain-containing protein [Clostridia bacterium]|nr:glutaredoxin domain-containing protein [Clostridia bacterium]
MGIKIYSTPSCPYCVMAKKYIEGKGHEVEYIDVSADSSKADEMVAKSGQYTVPVIDIDDNIIVGFNRSEIDKHLGK